MLRAVTALVLSVAIVACQPSVPQADAASLSQQSAAPEYMNPNPRAPSRRRWRNGAARDSACSGSRSRMRSNVSCVKTDRERAPETGLGGTWTSQLRCGLPEAGP